jgi:hypothetical protein
VGNREASDGQLGNWHLFASRTSEEERITRARRIWLKFEPRMKKEMAAGFGWKSEARVCNPKNHARFALYQASRRDSARRVV